MPNTFPTPVLNTWVKNVYSLCVEGVVNRVKSYTGMGPVTTYAVTERVKPQVFTISFNSFTPALYTVNFGIFNLLNTYLYTLSTVPTIKKMKKK